MPLKHWGEGIGARAEIQHFFFGFFALSLSSTSMNFTLWKGNHHKKPFFSKILGLDVLNVFCERYTSKEEGFYTLMCNFGSSG
jgi:hypothetical protein